MGGKSALPLLAIFLAIGDNNSSNRRAAWMASLRFEAR
jgi:hypothetical protein